VFISFSYVVYIFGYTENTPGVTVILSDISLSVNSFFTTRQAGSAG